MSLLKRLWLDTGAAVYSAEIALVAAVMVMGLVGGWRNVRSAVHRELSDMAGAFTQLDQSFLYRGAEGHSGGVAGSQFSDQPFSLHAPGLAGPGPNVCIEIDGD
jgi:hypothetical protein